MQQVEASHQKLSCLGRIVMFKQQLEEFLRENPLELLCNGSN
jgi:hypothetical protein